jgi:hypothetical protein
MSELSTERVRGEFFESVLVDDHIGSLVTPCTWGQGCHRVIDVDDLAAYRCPILRPDASLAEYAVEIGATSVGCLSNDSLVTQIREIYDNNEDFHSLVSKLR